MRNFRGLTKDGKWVYGWYMEHPFSDNPTVNCSVIVQDERPYEVIPETVGQFVTKDKNGKNVFAGDSVKSGKRILTILWGKETLQWRTRLEGSRYTTPLSQWAISEQFELIEKKENE